MKLEKENRIDSGRRAEKGRLVGPRKGEEKISDVHQSNLMKLPPLTSPSDANVDPWSLDALLQQSYHLISMLRMSMSSWIISSEVSRNKKILVTRRYEIPTVAMEMPLEIVLSKSRLLEYMELCSSFGMTSIEYLSGHPDAVLSPKEIIKLAAKYELDILAKVNLKRGAEGDKRKNVRLVDECKEWLDSGAKYLVVDPFEPSSKLLPSKSPKRLSRALAESLAISFGLNSVMFEAPVRENQTLLIDHFGPEVRLCGVRLEEILELEAYRRQPYSGFFGGAKVGAYLYDLEKRHYDSPSSEENLNKNFEETHEVPHRTK